MNKPIVINVSSIRKNENGRPGALWLSGGRIIISDSVIELQSAFNLTMAEYSIEDTLCWRDRKEELLFHTIVRFKDEKQDHSVRLLPDRYEKLMSAIRERKALTTTEEDQ